MKQDDTYDLVDEAPLRQARASANHETPTIAPATLAYRSVNTTKPSADPVTLKNIHIPLALLIGGIAIETVAGMIRLGSFDRALENVAMEMLVGVPIMLAAIVIVAKMRGIELGPMKFAALKLAAISIAPSAVFHLALPVLIFIPLVGPLAGWLGEFVLYFALIGVLFDLDQEDTWSCVISIFIVSIAVAVGLAFLKL